MPAWSVGSRELCQPRTEGDAEARHEEPPEPSRAPRKEPLVRYGGGGRGVVHLRRGKESSVRAGAGVRAHRRGSGWYLPPTRELCWLCIAYAI
jgi:hypothetical protein